MLTIAIDGTKLAGKTTFANELKRQLEKMGLKAEVFTHPDQTALGQRAKYAILNNDSVLKQIRCLKDNFLQTLGLLNTLTSIDVAIFDGWVPSIYMHYGTDAEVHLNGSSVFIHPYAPVRYVELTTSQERMRSRIKRIKTRADKVNIDWDAHIVLSHFGHRSCLAKSLSSTMITFHEIWTTHDVYLEARNLKRLLYGQ